MRGSCCDKKGVSKGASAITKMSKSRKERWSHEVPEDGNEL